MKKPVLESLVLKPVLHCNANCSFCSSRLALHKDVAQTPGIDLQGWKEVVRDAAALGAKKISISGGEPTLYEDLPALVRFIKEQGLFAKINSNGLLLDHKMIRVLEEAGLDQIMLSIYSQQPAVHDELKSTPGIFEKSLRAIEAIRSSSIELNIQTILTRSLLAELDQFIEWACQADAVLLTLTYLEGHQTPELLPTQQDIRDFRRKTLPRCQQILRQHLAGKPQEYRECKRELNRLFNIKKISRKSLAKGIYNPLGFIRCSRPARFCIILANGDIHPCNAIEYYHKPIVGNLKEKPLREWWTDPQWDSIREKGPGWCRICPIRHHRSLRLSPKK